MEWFKSKNATGQYSPIQLLTNIWSNPISSNSCAIYDSPLDKHYELGHKACEPSLPPSFGNGLGLSGKISSVYFFVFFYFKTEKKENLKFPYFHASPLILF